MRSSLSQEKRKKFLKNNVNVLAPETTTHSWLLFYSQLSRNKDVADLAEGIVQLLRDDDLRARMSTDGRRIAEAEYALPVQAARFRDLYAEQQHQAGIPLR